MKASDTPKRQYLMAMIDCENDHEASDAAGLLHRTFGDRLTGMLRVDGPAPPSWPTVDELMLELGWRKTTGYVLDSITRRRP